MNKAVVHKLQRGITWGSFKSTDAGSGPRFLNCVERGLGISSTYNSNVQHPLGISGMRCLYSNYLQQ